MTDYRVELEVYNGPLDLLLFLIRREEVDVHDIPIARITEQYLAYVTLLKQIDPEGISEFLVLAATLLEIKSRMLLPRPPVEEHEDDMGDPRYELVRQLLQYQRFKEAARRLEDAVETHHRRHPRVPATAGPPVDGVELENVEVWDLFDAFRGLLEQTGKIGPVHKVGIDDTPVLLHAEDMLDSLERSGGVQKFSDIFAGRTRGEMIGLFLALLELIRQRRVRASQDAAFAPILIHLIDATPLDEIPDDYDGVGPFRSTEADTAPPAAETLDADPTTADGEDEDLDDEMPPLIEPNIGALDEDSTETGDDERSHHGLDGSPQESPHDPH